VQVILKTHAGVGFGLPVLQSGAGLLYNFLLVLMFLGPIDILNPKTLTNNILK